MKIRFDMATKKFQVCCKKRNAVINEFKTYTAALKFVKINKKSRGVV